MTDSQQFRADGHAAIDWAADYLEGIRERPVMSTVEPGEIRAGLPASPPRRPSRSPTCSPISTAC